MHGFAIVIGACKVVPPSPALALLLVMWMFGAAPGRSYDSYRSAYVAGGGGDQVAMIERCFLDWPGATK